MIESKILGEAAGIQYQGVKDLSETSNPASLTNGCIIGRFKRGRRGVPFKVTKDNYQAKLGTDSKNPDYLAVEDAFRLGLSELTIMRVGSSVKSRPQNNGGANTDNANFLTLADTVGEVNMVLNFETFFPNIDLNILNHGASCGIKIQIDNQAPFVSTFQEEGMQLLDSALATCLSPIFVSQTIQTYGLKKFDPDLPYQGGHFIEGNAPDNTLSYGFIEILDADNSYGLDVSQAPMVLVSHVPSLLKRKFNDEIMPPPEYENNYAGWTAHLESLSDSELADMYMNELSKKIIMEKHTITFLPKSEDDRYLDLFEVLFKSQKVNKPIPQFNLTPASVQKDKIVFTSLCQVQNLSPMHF